MEYLRVPPSAIDIEKSVIASMMTNISIIADNVGFVNEDYFYSSANKTIFSAIIEMFSKGVAVDVLTVSEKLRSIGELENVGGECYLSDIAYDIQSFDSIDSHVKILKDKMMLRKMISVSTRIANSSFDPDADCSEIIDSAEKEISEVSLSRFSGEEKTIREVMAETTDDLDKRMRGQIVGLTTGSVGLDMMIGGMEGGNLIIIAGRPSMGKTALALCMIYSAMTVQSAYCAIFSYEMSNKQIMRRLIAIALSISIYKMRTGDLGTEEWRKINDMCSNLDKYPLFLDDDSSNTLSVIKAKCRRMKKNNNLKLIVVDYLQLMPHEGKYENNNLAIGAISRGLKALAKELDVPVIALSQLSRLVEQRADNRPTLADLRGSGEIEQDADIVIFPFREDKYKKDAPKGVAEIIVGKQRDGETGTVNSKFMFVGEYGRFDEVSDVDGKNF
jgi:replicative DNA helicase